MVSFDTLFLCSLEHQPWLCSSLVLKLFCQNQGLSSYKIVLVKKNVHHEKYETLLTNLPIQSYINRIHNRLVFKIKDGCILELQTPET